MVLKRAFQTIIIIGFAFSSTGAMARWPKLPKCGGSVCKGLEHGKNEAKKTAEKAGKKATKAVGKVGTAVWHGVTNVVTESLTQLAGHPLALWIQQSRDHSLSTSKPIPPQVRAALKGYVPDVLMDAAHYKTNDQGLLNTAHAIHGLDRGVEAVTLVDVIIFKDGRDAANNYSLWAHELTHVGQYREMGVRKFALRYTRDKGSLEDPAYSNGNGYRQWAKSHPRP